MDDSIDLAIALDSVNRKIAEINIKLAKSSESEEVEEELNKWLTIKEEIYKGNAELIKKVIENEI